MTDIFLPADDFTIDASGTEAFQGGGVQVVPHISVQGTTFTIRLLIETPVGKDTKTFVLAKKNSWKETQTYFKWPSATDVTIEVQRPQKRVHIHVAPPIVSAVDKYVPFEMLRLPGDFKNWAPHKGPEYDQIKAAADKANPVGKSLKLDLQEDKAGVEDRCSFLGDGDFLANARKAMAANAPKGLEAFDPDDVLMAIGVLAQGGAFVGGSLGGGIWWTFSKAGLYGSVGAQMGAILGGDVEAVITFVFGEGGKNAIENFEKYHIARGIIGEGAMMSIALLGDVRELDLYGFMFGGGLGGGATPAGGYVGAARQYLHRF